MSCNRFVSVRAGLTVITLATFASFPLAAWADKTPESIVALLPNGAMLGDSDWAVMDTEFGKSFGGSVRAKSFPGQTPSCDLEYLPGINIDIKGDTAWENPPMLEMAIEIHEQEIAGASASMPKFITNFKKSAPDGVAIGDVHEEQRANGYIVFVEFMENCSSHPNGKKTSLRGLARRGATQLDFTLVLALDSATTASMAYELLGNFEKLDITALTE